MIQKLIKKRKRQDQRVPKKKISATASVQFLSSIKMSQKTLKFGFIRLDNLDLVNLDQIVISDRFKHSDDCFKNFIGYKEGEIVKPLCIIFPQKSGYIK